LALSAADLIKNKLFQQASSQQRELDDCKEAWSNVLTATRDDDIVDFLRYYWIATQRFVRKQYLYNHYKKHISALSAKEAGNFALGLYFAAFDYAQIVNPRTGTKFGVPEIADAVERLNVYRARQCRPVLLACSDSVSKNREVDLARVVRICESITVR
jgi:hypothetical protein